MAHIIAGVLFSSITFNYLPRIFVITSRPREIVLLEIGGFITYFPGIFVGLRNFEQAINKEKDSWVANIVDIPINFFNYIASFWNKKTDTSSSDLAIVANDTNTYAVVGNTDKSSEKALAEKDKFSAEAICTAYAAVAVAAVAIVVLYFIWRTVISFTIFRFSSFLRFVRIGITRLFSKEMNKNLVKQ